MSDNITGYRGEESIPLNAMEWRWVTHEGKAMTKWSRTETPPMLEAADKKGMMYIERRFHGAEEQAGKFKEYVHARLDEMKVPHEVPESEHTKAGCRIGGRLDWVEERLDGPCRFSRTQLKNLLIVMSGPQTRSPEQGVAMAEHLLERYDNDPALRELVSQED